MSLSAKWVRFRARRRPVMTHKGWVQPGDTGVMRAQLAHGLQNRQAITILEYIEPFVTKPNTEMRSVNRQDAYENKKVPSAAPEKKRTRKRRAKRD